MAVAYGQAYPYEAKRWDLVRELGWTLAQVDALTVQDWHNYEQVKDGQRKGMDSRRRRKVK
jgi:hypothetical protein